MCPPPAAPRSWVRLCSRELRQPGVWQKNPRHSEFQNLPGPSSATLHVTLMLPHGFILSSRPSPRGRRPRQAGAWPVGLPAVLLGPGGCSVSRRPRRGTVTDSPVQRLLGGSVSPKCRALVDASDLCRALPEGTCVVPSPGDARWPKAASLVAEGARIQPEPLLPPAAPVTVSRRLRPVGRSLLSAPGVCRMVPGMWSTRLSPLGLDGAGRGWTGGGGHVPQGHMRHAERRARATHEAATLSLERGLMSRCHLRRVS